MQLKLQRSEKLLEAKELLAKQVSVAQHTLIRERDAIDNELLMRQTTGSWKTLSTDKLCKPSFSATAPLPRVVGPRVHSEALDINISSTAAQLNVDLYENGEDQVPSTEQPQDEAASPEGEAESESAMEGAEDHDDAKDNTYSENEDGEAAVAAGDGEQNTAMGALVEEDEAQLQPEHHHITSTTGSSN